jgi:hypothetical protein
MRPPARDTALHEQARNHTLFTVREACAARLTQPHVANAIGRLPFWNRNEKRYSPSSVITYVPNSGDWVQRRSSQKVPDLVPDDKHVSCIRDPRFTDAKQMNNCSTAADAHFMQWYWLLSVLATVLWHAFPTLAIMNTSESELSQCSGGSNGVSEKLIHSLFRASSVKAPRASLE